MGDTLLLVDAYSLIYRAFYAIRTLTGPKGEPVNALFGFTKMLKKLQADYEPSHWAVVFDLGAPKQRLAMAPSYKAQRPPTPPDLDQQLPAIRAALAGMRVPVVEIDGEEADDIIGTLAKQAAKAGHEVLIASSDKDFMQIVGGKIKMIKPDGKESAVFDDEGVMKRYGVKPAQIVDFLSLIGDNVDNIPGVPGIGEKTAAELLGKYGNLDALLEHAAEIPKPKLREALLAHADQVRTNRELIKLQCSLKLPVTVAELKVQPPDAKSLAEIYRQYGFKSLLAEVEKSLQDSHDLFAPK